MTSQNDPRSVIPKQPDWLRDRTIYLARHGSHAYGTSTPESDLDMKGFAIPPREYFLGSFQKFEQAISADPVDLVIYDVRKFINLAADCNPSIIEVLWVDESDIIWISKAGRAIREARASFLSQKAKHTFSGYAVSQIKRIKTHRRWLLDPPKKKPEREDFGLPVSHRVLPPDQLGAVEAEVRAKIDSWNLDLSDLDDARRIYLLEMIEKMIVERTSKLPEPQAMEVLGFGDNFIEYFMKEREYRAALNEWNQYQSWKENRNAKRAELEARFGYDGKHASHVVRLMRMCREILEGKGVIVKRPDAEELLAIKNGVWSYEKLIEFAEGEDEALYQVMKTSPLPKKPDRATIDKLCIEVCEEALRYDSSNRDHASFAHLFWHEPRLA